MFTSKRNSNNDMDLKDHHFDRGFQRTSSANWTVWSKVVSPLKSGGE